MDKTNFITVKNLENELFKKTYSIPKNFAYNLLISKQNIVNCLEELESFDIIESFEDFIYLNNINLS